MIGSLSSVGDAEVSTPAMPHAQHKEFEYKQKQELGCLGGRRYVVEDEGDNEPPCAMPGPRERSKLEHEKKVGQVGQVAATTLDWRTADDLCAQVPSAARAAVQQGVKPKPGSQEAQIARLGKEEDTLQQRVDHFQSTVDVLQEAADQAKAEIAGLQTDVRRLTEENAWLWSERDNAVQVRERAVADATWLWPLVDCLAGDSPMRGSQGMGSGICGIGSPRKNRGRLLVLRPPPLRPAPHVADRERRVLPRQEGRTPWPSPVLAPPRWPSRSLYPHHHLPHHVS